MALLRPSLNLAPARVPGLRARGHARTRPAWVPELVLRMRRLFLLKLLGTCALVGLFFVAYFDLLRDPARPVATMPLTALDQVLPFQPAMLYAYLSLWVYVGTAPGLLLTLRDLLAYALWAGGLAGAGLGIFHFWPTAVPTLTVGVSGLPGFALLQGVDAPGNACPSMHVAFALLSFAWIERILKQAGAPALLRGLNLLWFLAITWSTLAIRQHVVLDVGAGALLGTLFAALSIRFAGVNGPAQIIRPCNTASSSWAPAWSAPAPPCTWRCAGTRSPWWTGASPARKPRTATPASSSAKRWSPTRSRRTGPPWRRWR